MSSEMLVPHNFHWFAGNFQPFAREHVTHVDLTVNSYFTFLIVKCKPTFLEFSHDSIQVLIMLLVSCTNYPQVILEVVRTRTVLDDLSNNLLEFFCSHVHTEEQALVPVQPIWGSECCNVSGVWVQLNLMEGHI